MYRLQAVFPQTLLGRLAISLTLLATVEAGLNSSGLCPAPKLGLVSATAFAFVRADATASPQTRQAGFWGKLWCTLRGNPGSCLPPDPTERASQVPPDLESLRRARVRDLQRRHDREPDLSKKISYDREIMDLLDPIVDFEKIKALQSEIKQHEQELQQFTKEQRKQQLIQRTQKLLEEKKYAEAEQEAERAVQIFNDAQTQQLLNDAKTQRLIEEVKDALAMKDVDVANVKNRQALKLTPDNREAQRIQRDIDIFIGKRNTLLVLKIVLIVLLTAAPLAGLYLLLRPRKWVLEGIDGACKEKIFPLDTDELKIGALGPPHGECDIVIRDVRRKISPVHCLIVRNGRSLYIINESPNGTLINDEEVEKGSMMRLRQGDRLSLADEAMLVLRAD